MVMLTSQPTCIAYLCIPTWNMLPHLGSTPHQRQLEKFALKMCLEQWDLGHQDLLDLSQFPTLENHRLYLKLCTLH